MLILMVLSDHKVLPGILVLMNMEGPLLQHAPSSAGHPATRDRLVKEAIFNTLLIMVICVV